MHYFAFGSTAPAATWNDSGNNAFGIVGYVIEWTPKEELPPKRATAEVKPADAAGGSSDSAGEETTSGAGN